MLAIEPMVNAGQAGSEGIEGQVDGGDEGRVVLGALRALRGGDGERAVGSDQAVSQVAGARVGGVRSCPARSFKWSWKRSQQVLAHLAGEAETEFCPAGAGRSGGGGA